MVMIFKQECKKILRNEEIFIIIISTLFRSKKIKLIHKNKPNYLAGYIMNLQINKIKINKLNYFKD